MEDHDSDHNEEDLGHETIANAVQRVFNIITNGDYRAFCIALDDLLALNDHHDNKNDSESTEHHEDFSDSESEEDSLTVDICFSYKYLLPEQFHLSHAQLQHTFPFYNHSLLAYAVKVGSLPIVNELLSRGVSLYPNGRLFGPGGGCICHPIIIAIRNGYLPILEKLVSIAGMDINIYKPLLPVRPSRRPKYRFSETLDYLFHYRHFDSDSSENIVNSDDDDSNEDEDNDDGMMVEQPFINHQHPVVIEGSCPHATYEDLIRYCFHGSNISNSIRRESVYCQDLPSDPIGVGLDCTSFDHTFVSPNCYQNMMNHRRKTDESAPLTVDNPKFIQYRRRVNQFIQQAWCSSAQGSMSIVYLTEYCALSSESNMKDLTFWLENAEVPLNEEDVLKMTNESLNANKYFANKAKNKYDENLNCPEEKRIRTF